MINDESRVFCLLDSFQIVTSFPVIHLRLFTEFTNEDCNDRSSQFHIFIKLNFYINYQDENKKKAWFLTELSLYSQWFFTEFIVNQ